MKKVLYAVMILLFGAMVTGCAGKTEVATTPTPAATEAATVTPTEAPTTAPVAEKTELTIMAAASLTGAMEEITALYEKIKPEVTLTFSYGASGTLQTQIEEGSPADIFFSAATKQMDALDAEGLILSDTRNDLLLNELVLVVPADSTLGLTSFDDVATDAVKMVALGDPGTVPAGQYAEDTFTTLGVLDKIKAKANYGTDVKQVLSWVETSEVDCGIVYKTDALGNDKVKIICEAPADSHKEIVYPTCVLKDSASPEEAKAFVEYLATDEAKAVFEKYGFGIK